jgi:antitoxin component of MazEF toxin-antitoxin module
MSKYIATVIKTGNSYALRVPKAYIEDARLTLGDKADLALPQIHKKQDPEKLQKLWQELQGLKPFREIEDPVAWQREIRKDRPLPGRD